VGNPFHVLLRLHVPLDRQALHVRHHVAVGRAAPHRPVAGAGIGCSEERQREQDDSHWFATIFRLSRYAPNSASTNSPGAPFRLPIGSTLSIVQSPGSVSPVGQALPRARTLPSGMFSTRNFK